MKTRTALALILGSFVTTACTTSDDVTGGTGAKVEIRHIDNAVEGTLTKNDVSIEFKIEDNAHLVINTPDHVKLVDVSRSDSYMIPDLATLRELDVVRDLPEALAIEGIDIGALIDASPALTDVFCPTRDSFDPITQSDTTDLARN